MKEYPHRKKHYWAGVVFLWSLVAVLTCIAIKFSPSVLGICVMNAIVAALFSVWLYKEYQSLLILADETMTVTSRGNTYRILYKDIMYIQYTGIPHCLLGDTMVLHCGMTGKIYVDASYENYLTLWREITLKAQAANPRLTISPRMNKRIAKKK